MPLAKKNTRSGVIGGVLAGLVVLGLIVYILYQGFSSFAGNVATVAVAVSDTRTVANGQACVIREEKVILAETGGVMDPLVGNGERVSADTPLVRVYAMPAEDAANIEAQLAEADAEIAFLSASMEGGNVTTAHADRLRGEVYDAYADLLMTVRSGQYDNVQAAADSMLLSLNRYGVLTGDAHFGPKLAMWQARREEILRDFGSGSVLTSREWGSGYFYHRPAVDGYEALLSPADLSRLTANDLAAVLATPDPVTARTAGKIVYGYIWYLALPASLDVAGKVAAGNTYEVSFTGQGVTLPMTLQQINVTETEDDALLIFSCTRMPAGFSFERVQNVELLIDTVSGFRIPEDALVTLDGRIGVWVLDGSIVGFRRITVMNLGDGYVLAAVTDPEPDVPGLYLSANDLLVLSDEKLYDGKILS